MCGKRRQIYDVNKSKIYEFIGIDIFGLNNLNYTLFLRDCIDWFQIGLK